MGKRVRVVKFGGSNFKAVGDIGKILQTIGLYEKPPVVVVSAFYGITDELMAAMDAVTDPESAIADTIARLKGRKRESVEVHIADGPDKIAAYEDLARRLDDLEKVLLGAHYIGEIPDFVRDKVLSYGERLSSLILTRVLNHHGIEAVEKLPEDIGLVTDGAFRNAAVDFEGSVKSVRKALRGGKVFVVPGFYGVSPDGRVTLLGRGGSDYSAAALARCVDAESLDVWKDVDGFMSADPQFVSHPRRIDRLGYREAAELSYFGARILHPRTVEPLDEPGIPVRIFNIDEKPPTLTPLTVIGPDKDARPGPKSVTYADDFAVLTLDGAGVGIKPGILARVTGTLDREGINIKSVVTSQTAINVYLDESDLDRTAQAVKKLDLAAVTRVIPRRNLSVVALVGDGLRDETGVAEGMIDALDRAGLRYEIFSIGASDAAAYAVVRRTDRLEAVRALHRRFFEG